MTIMFMLFTMLAFAVVYAAIGTMIGENLQAIRSALRGGAPVQAIGTAAASRAFNRA